MFPRTDKEPGHEKNGIRQDISYTGSTLGGTPAGKFIIGEDVCGKALFPSPAFPFREKITGAYMGSLSLGQT